jgi:hypothetical protein
MAWKLFYYDEVLLDVRDAKKWYKEQQEGLEKRFAKDVKECISRLQKDPFHYEIRYKQVRLAHCAVFPFSIHFYINDADKQLVIIAIVHQHRHPDIAQDRKS